MAGGTTTIELAGTKQRKAPGGEPTTPDVDLEVANQDGTKGEQDVKKTSAQARFSAIRRYAKFLLVFVLRRIPDFISLSGLWTAWGTGYWYSTTRLLQPPDNYLVIFNSVCCHAAFVLSILSWIGVMYFGPGRIPEEKKDCQLPKGTMAMLAVGRVSPKKPWGPQPDWCAPCCRWKPPFGHHCKICNTCSLWMDHHCNFCGQCIGFRNLRCFLLMLFYTQSLCMMFGPSVLWKMVCFQSMNWRELSFFGAFVFGWMYLLMLVRGFLNKLLWGISGGWPSSVMLAKYEGLFHYSTSLVLKYQQREKEGDLDRAEFTKSFANARDDVVRSRGAGLRGIFNAGNFVSSLEFAFGAPVSWRWLLPLVPGGTGDPFSPDLCDESACEAWAQLGIHIAATTRHDQEEADERNKLAQRFQALEEHARTIGSK